MENQGQTLLKPYLAELGFSYDEQELSELIELIGGAQALRFGAGMSETDQATRSTAIVVISQYSAKVLAALEGTGINWSAFRESIGLSMDQTISAEKDVDLDLHYDFSNAIALYAQRNPQHRYATAVNLAIAIIEHMAQEPDAGKLGTRFAEFGGDVGLFRLEPESLEPPESNTWLCQYRPDEATHIWTEKAEPGTIIRWKTGKTGLPADMNIGDSVIYWRTVGSKEDRGGIVGTGFVQTNTLEKDVNGMGRFETRVQEFFESDPLPRDEVLEYANITRKVWQGAVLGLAPAEARKINELLLLKGRLPIFPVVDEVTRVRILRDDPESAYDALGRAPLAVSFAGKLHEIWCAKQGLKPFTGHKPPEDSSGFVVHIDSPWGGGKTTFANLVTCILNPGKRTIVNHRANKEPSRKVDQPQQRSAEKSQPENLDFMERLYPGKQDRSGLFISATQEENLLAKDGEKTRWPLDARRPWVVVSFNGWLHQHIEPPWRCFYQKIRAACFKTIKSEGLSSVHQNADGSYFTKNVSWLARQPQRILLFANEIWWRLTNHKLLFQIAVLAISIIVVVLSLYYGSKETTDKNGLWAYLPMLLKVTGSLTGAVSFITLATTIVADTLSPGRNVMGEQFTLGEGDPLRRFRKHFQRMIKIVRRPVIVVIDDLDRCKPEFIVELTRGLQTILLSPRIVYLILGDRKWIEKAFEVQHEKMNTVDVGTEYTFGGRFVQKIIQLSYSLPAMTAYQENYVREVLMGRTDAATQRLQWRKEIAEAKTVEEIDRKGSELEKASQASGDKLQGSIDQQVIREEVILRRAAQQEEIREDIQHRLQAIAPYLPSNPRHIKRIVSAIAIYQDSILLTEGVSEDTKAGGKSWREIVIGVVLMMGFPKSWALLAANPLWANCLVGADAASKIAKSTTEKQLLDDLRKKKVVVGLLKETKFQGEGGKGTVDTIIDANAIRRLCKIFPVNL
jgi:hypothetical protein